MANGRANACAANPTSDLAISKETLHLDRFLSLNQRKNRFSWNGDVDDLEQFLKARFVMGIEDGDSTSGKLRMSCNGSCAVLKLPRATFNFYLNTKTLQIQGSACGDIRKVLEDIVKNVLASQTSNHDGKGEYSAESTVLANGFIPENVAVNPESSPEIQVFQALNEDSEEDELNLSLSPEIHTNNVDTIEGCVHNCHCGELNANLLEKVETLQTNVLSLQNQINSFTRDRSPNNNEINDYGKKFDDLSREFDFVRSKNRQYADELRIANEEKQCLLTSLRILSKESKEFTNNFQHELPNVDLIAENKSLQETITILNNDNQVLSAKVAELSDRHGNQATETADFNKVKSKKKKKKNEGSKQGETEVTIDQKPETTDTTVIIGDSIIKGLRRDLLSRAAKRRVTVRSFPGATVGDMKHYLQPSLQLKPSEIVLHVGTNDLRDRSSRDVAEQIVDLGNLVSSSSPDTKVTISALTQRYDEECLGKKVTDCNKVIKSFCNQNGWGFVKHPNIDESCVNNQKLHLNKKGIAILASNLVNHIVH